MSGFTNADGSTLVGGQKPGGQGQALQVDSSGNLLVNVAVGGGGGGGSSVNIADATTPANKMAIDASGRIGINNFPGEQAINLNQINGSALSVNNPLITEDQIRAWIVNGQGFSATTGKLTSAGAITGGLSVFNPSASGKTLIVFSLVYLIGNNSFNQLDLVSSDPALGTSVSALNNKAGSATSSVASCSSANTSVSPEVTVVISVGSASNTFTQVLLNGNLFVLPPGNGLAFYSNVSGANSWAVTFTWIEI